MITKSTRQRGEKREKARSAKVECADYYISRGQITGRREAVGI